MAQSLFGFGPNPSFRPIHTTGDGGFKTAQRRCSGRALCDRSPNFPRGAANGRCGRPPRYLLSRCDYLRRFIGFSRDGGFRARFPPWHLSISLKIDVRARFSFAGPIRSTPWAPWFTRPSRLSAVGARAFRKKLAHQSAFQTPNLPTS